MNKEIIANELVQIAQELNNEKEHFLINGKKSVTNIAGEVMKIAGELSDKDKHERLTWITSLKTSLFDVSNLISHLKYAPFFVEEEKILSEMEKELDLMRKKLNDLLTTTERIRH